MLVATELARPIQNAGYCLSRIALARQVPDLIIFDIYRPMACLIDFSRLSSMATALLPTISSHQLTCLNRCCPAIANRPGPMVAINLVVLHAFSRPGA